MQQTVKINLVGICQWPKANGQKLLPMDILIEIIGWIGSIEVLLAYGLNSYQRLRSDSMVFYMLNLTGGLALIFYTVYKAAYASAFINVVWVIIAAIAIGRVMMRKNAAGN
jgi:hypothetical protein